MTTQLEARHALEIMRLRSILKLIANTPPEDDEWDAVDKFQRCRQIAIEGLKPVKSD